MKGIKYAISRRPTWLAVGAAALVAHCAAPDALAQCGARWHATDGLFGGTGPTVFAMTEWDPDGSGPSPSLLVVGGDFTMAGSVPATNVALWDGAAWSALGSGTNGDVNALAALPNGELVAAGAFTSAGGVAANYVARWNGSSWAALGTGMNNVVNALTVMPNGDLVAGGFFTTAGGAGANRVARWNGTQWTNLGTGTDNIVWTLLAKPNGELIAGGQFTTAGGHLVNRIARWDGTNWWALGGANASVLSLELMPNGDLIAGGQFTIIGTAGASRIARYNGSTWAPLGSGILGNVWGLAVLETGDLVASGLFSSPASQIACWDGSAWTSMGTGMDAGVLDVCVRPDGDLMAGGFFTTAGDVVTSCLARWAPGGLPSLTVQPQPGAACAASTAAFTVGAAGEALTYQWRHDGTFLDDRPTGMGSVISGATTSALEIGSLSAADAGVYDCIVSNACGSVISDAAALTVVLGDLNGDLAIDLADLSNLLTNFGAAGGMSLPDGDIDGDGDVDLADLSGLLTSFGTSCP